MRIVPSGHCTMLLWPGDETPFLRSVVKRGLSSHFFHGPSGLVASETPMP